MPRDLEIPLCQGCIARPMDPDTGRRVEGGLNITSRSTILGQAVVVYSQEDPRLNQQYLLDSSADTSEAVRRARACTPTARGLEAGLGSFDKRIAETNKHFVPNCRLQEIIREDNALPEGLLFQVDEAVRK